VSYPNKTRFIALYRAMQTGHPTAQTQYKSLGKDQQEKFDQFVFDCGAVFLELKDELDQGLEDLADYCPEETDPRKWHSGEWITFHQAVEGHKFQEIYTLMAQGKENIHLIWQEVEKRL